VRVEIYDELYTHTSPVSSIWNGFMPVCVNSLKSNHKTHEGTSKYNTAQVEAIV